jgi:predicted dehydrogenase
MLPEMGPPETYIWEYPGDDKSWKSEYDDFLNCISKGEKINGNLYDAYKSLEIVDKVYFMNKK